METTTLWWAYRSGSHQLWNIDSSVYLTQSHWLKRLTCICNDFDELWPNFDWILPKWRLSQSQPYSLRHWDFHWIFSLIAIQPKQPIKIEESFRIKLSLSWLKSTTELKYRLVFTRFQLTCQDLRIRMRNLSYFYVEVYTGFIYT